MESKTNVGNDFTTLLKLYKEEIDKLEREQKDRDWDSYHKEKEKTWKKMKSLKRK